jgi:hypothetical protein
MTLPGPGGITKVSYNGTSDYIDSPVSLGAEVGVARVR